MCNMNKSEPSNDQQDKQAVASQPIGDTQTRFAWLRTRMALQTTLAAWVRTATSLIGFGFAIVQFLEHFGSPGSSGPGGWHVARIMGLVLITAGTLTTAVAMCEYRLAVNYLQSDVFRNVAGIPILHREPPDVAVWMAVLVCLIGILAFVLILTTPAVL
jgi:inner membrane protein YidH